MLVPILLAFIVSDKKLWIILYDFPLDVIWIFLLASFNFFFSSINFQHFNYNIPWGSFLCLYIAWGFCNSLEKIHYCFFQWFFFSPLSFLSFHVDSNHTYVKPLNNVPQNNENLFNYFSIFVLSASPGYFHYLSSRLLQVYLTVSNLLFNLSNKYFNLNGVCFDTSISIW